MLALAVAAACGDDGADDVLDLDRVVDASGHGQLVVDASAGTTVRLRATDLVIEGWLDGDGAAFADPPPAQLATGASAAWAAPRPVDGEVTWTIAGGDTLTLWARGPGVPAIRRERALTWLTPVLLDDPAVVSLSRLLAVLGGDGHGGALLERWFTAFSRGPGAGRAAFAQFLDEVRAAQGADARRWDLTTLPFTVTGVHLRHDLADADGCGQLRVSLASTHPVLAPAHLIFLFDTPPGADDVTPDGHVHCRGVARRWARLGAGDDAGWQAAARQILDEALVPDRFLLAESVELTVSPWQWRQWEPDGAGGLRNPPLAQTVDLARVDAAGPVREAFLVDVAAHAADIAAQRWVIPAAYRAPTAEVDPNARAGEPDLTPLPDVVAAYPSLGRSLVIVGCPRCHTEDADFVQTSVARQPSPFYDRELDARAARLDALGRGEWPEVPAFAPLQR
ncbi:MAG: hypothetical protein KA190_14970 [Kofleriaceae bacterium]|nr:hypothetical protein [Kofleriaceae bacterium]